MACMITYKEFNPQHLTLEPPKTKTYEEKNPDGTPQLGPDGKPKTGSYKTANLSYLYDITVTPMIDTTGRSVEQPPRQIRDFLYAESSVVECSGITYPGEGKYNKHNYETYTRYNKSLPEIKEYIEFMDKLVNRVAELCFQNAQALGIDPSKFTTSDHIKQFLLSKVYFYPKDKVTEQIDYNKNPASNIKLSKKNNYPQSKDCNFFVEEEADIPWNKLRKVNFTGKQLVKYSHLYIGGKSISIQRELDSMFIEDVSETSGGNRQIASLQRMRNENPQEIDDIQRKVQDMLKKLSMGSAAVSINSDESKKNNEESNVNPPSAPIQNTSLGIPQTNPVFPASFSAPAMAGNPPAPIASQINFPSGTPEQVMSAGTPATMDLSAFLQKNPQQQQQGYVGNFDPTMISNLSAPQPQ